MSFKRASNIVGVIVFLTALCVYFLSAERTGSLWDCGEFVLGAYKLEVVHPPGAALFMLVGRMFTWVATIVSDNPSDIAFSVNLMSGLFSALAAMCIAWVTMIFGKISLVGRKEETDLGQNVALGFAGLVSGLTAAFCTSVWFSAVEGEVYAMSTFFNALTIWTAIKWYNLPDDTENDRWLVLCLFGAGMSIGVHLLSLLTLPAVALLYYFKKYEKHNIKGYAVALLAGLLFIWFVMKLVIVGIPTLWSKMELFTVNSLGMPFHSGLIPTVLIVGGICYYALKYTHRKRYQLLQTIFMSMTLIVIASATIGVIVIRANADTPVNMNTPSDAIRLIPYLNREQYGERPLITGPHFNAKPVGVKRETRYGRVGNSYKEVDEKLDYEWNKRDNVFLPRIGHQDRTEMHNIWREALGYPVDKDPGMGYNMAFLFKYQIGWMYWRYFMWNFVGRQNADQGFFPWNVKDGHWLSGIEVIDEANLYNMDKLPDAIKEEQSRNTYYFLPLLFGIFGLIYHFSKSKKEFFVNLLLFLITGLGIIIYSNQPPNEPRERDYVLVGSMMTFATWVGLGVLALFDVFTNRLKTGAIPGAAIAGVLALSAPVIMGFQNYDDLSRKEISASRDYASNFLNSLAKNAIIFTYGDNDTYPLWYAQEVEGIRTDVRVVNLSLIAVDWYINKLRTKVNDSPGIKLTIPEDLYKYKSMNQILLPEPGKDQVASMSLPDALKLAASGQKSSNGYPYWPTRNIYLPIDKQKFAATGMIKDSVSQMVDFIPIALPGNNYITKDDISVLDLIASNYYDRPIYFSVTAKEEKMMGMKDYTQLEGLALRLIPIRSQSDPQLGIYGSGRMANDLAYDNMMTKWKWGNFDKEHLFVDRSYMAEIQAMKFTMLRSAFNFINVGDSTKAVAIVNKYFEAFPNMNFRYDAGITSFINVLVTAGAYDDAKKHLKILAEETRQHMEFYLTLDEDDLQSFQSDMSYASRAVNDIISMSQRIGDPAFEKQMKDAVGKFAQQNPLPQ
ncbi:MAG: DUF2723 domain-containing protein [Saprospiraceae bacterium]|nr:DUF2723 domain-containing protein [Saprospiraceae bacterium]